MAAMWRVSGGQGGSAGGRGRKANRLTAVRPLILRPSVATRHPPRRARKPESVVEPTVALTGSVGLPSGLPDTTSRRPAPMLAVAAHAVTIGPRTFTYQRPWDGQRLELSAACPYVAFDTETEIVDLTRSVPRLALAAVSTGKQHALLHPDQVADFILRHADAHYVFFNVAFDFWTVDRHLRDRGEEMARRVWWDICHQDRMHCAMLLDMLIR